MIQETALQQRSSLNLGSVSLPVPPANVDPSDYSKWFDEKTGTGDGEINLVNALGLDVSVEREHNEAWYECPYARDLGSRELVTFLVLDKSET